MKVIGLIPIKLNSQRLQNKNILPLGENPLCYYICNTLSNVKNIDEVYVFCSSEEVCKYIPPSVKFLKREKRLDGNLVKGFEIYEEFMKEVDADIYVLAHTTSPFLKVKTIENALLEVLNGTYDSAFSARKFKTFAWYNNYPINYDLNDVPRTQDIEPIYIETSGFYIFKKEIFTEHHRRIGFHPYIQEVGDIEAIDIDEKEDFEMAKIFFDKFAFRGVSTNN